MTTVQQSSRPYAAGAPRMTTAAGLAAASKADMRKTFCARSPPTPPPSCTLLPPLTICTGRGAGRIQPALTSTCALADCNSHHHQNHHQHHHLAPAHHQLLDLIHRPKSAPPPIATQSPPRLPALCLSSSTSSTSLYAAYAAATSPACTTRGNSTTGSDGSSPGNAQNGERRQIEPQTVRGTNKKSVTAPKRSRTLPRTSHQTHVPLPPSLPAKGGGATILTPPSPPNRISPPGKHLQLQPRRPFLPGDSHGPPTPRRRTPLATTTKHLNANSSPSTLSHYHHLPSYKAAAAAIIQHHRAPPKPPSIQPSIQPLNLVAALLGEPANGQPDGFPAGSSHDNGNGKMKTRTQHPHAPRTSERRPSRPRLGVNGNHSIPTISEQDPGLPLNIRDIVSKCEDASMSWSLQFWVTIADPLTHHVFFACPASGQCSWEPPVGAFVVPRSSDGEWWELADPSRGNQSYYYNTLTGVTQWERPGGDAFVIPLGLIQRNALPAPRAAPTSGGGTRAQEPESAEAGEGSGIRGSSDNGAARDVYETSTTALRPPPPLDNYNHSPIVNSTSISGVRFAAHDNTTLTSLSSSVTSPSNIHPHSSDVPAITLVHSAASSSGPLTPNQDMGNSSDTPQPVEVLESIPPSPEPERQHSWWERRKGRAKKESHDSPNRASPGRGGGTPSAIEISGVVGTNDAATMFCTPPTSPIPVIDQRDNYSQEHLSPSSGVSLVFQPSSPMSATYEHHNFSTEDFADRYFATKRSGVLRQRLSLEQIMEWQRNPITSPLLVLSKQSVQDSLVTFKVIQHVMGERDRAVDGARNSPSIQATTSVLNLRTARDDRDEKTMILEEIRWMIQLGVGRVEMRDELYCQLIKQLTRNPDKDATVLGFQLFCVFVAAFGPSKSFEPFVRSFLVANVERTDFGIGIMSKFCLTRLDTWGQKGGRGRVLTLAEIEHASDAAFYPSVYGQTLETIMQRQEGAYPELRIPIILPFLADGILALGGTESEGIFRVPGDNDIIANLKTRIDRGQYQLDGVDDPHVVASLFKLWLRELEEPLVPASLYNAALQASKSVDLTILFIKKLPDHNRRVLLFVISFMQLFLDEEVVAVTKMTPQNLALILAPNILRTASDSLVTVFANSSFESQFVFNLLLHLDPPTIDPEYVPSHGQLGGFGMERASFDSAMSGSLETGEQNMSTLAT